MKNNYIRLILVAFVFVFASCANKDVTPLPILGNHELVNGKTIYHKIPDFNLINQDKLTVTNSSLASSIYLADFFFMSCPTICPKVKKQMLKLYNNFEANSRVKFVSHTIDPKRDTPDKLKAYAENLGVNTEKWMFLNGPKDDIFELADNYFVAAFEDDEAPGGFNHSGKIILVDTKGHVRAFAEGTDPDDVDDLVLDIHKLLAEYE